MEAPNLCSECWKKLEFITQPLCEVCGIPMEFKYSRRCYQCHIGQNRDYNKILAPLIFNDHSAKMVHALKYDGNIFIAKKMALFMFQIGKHMLEKADIICPVPMHNTKLYSRKFNQSHLLAYHIAKMGDKIHSLDNKIITKIRKTKPQSSLNKSEREKNLQKAFRISEEKGHLVKNKNILIVDDVITTGSTISACAKEFRKFGAHHIYILTFAKTFLPND